MFNRIRRFFRRSVPEEYPSYQRDIVDTAHTKVKMWYPEAKRFNDIRLRTRGEHENDYPQGMIVHFTAGWQMKHPVKPGKVPTKSQIEEAKRYAKGVLELAQKNGYCYMVIDALGNVYQQSPLNKWGYHAGSSYWHNLGHSVSSKLVGVEILSAGKLSKRHGKYFTWYGQEIPKWQVREIKEHEYHNGEPGFYQMYTASQERALVKLNYWLKSNNPKVYSYNFVLGHDEVAPSRKNDPGGALSMSMRKFREKLISESFPIDEEA